MTLGQFRLRLSRSFWCGYFFHMFFTLLHQDWYGLEGYVELCRQHWSNIPWWMWVPLLVLTLLVDWENGKMKPTFFSRQKAEAKKFELGGTVYEGHSREES